MMARRSTLSLSDPNVDGVVHAVLYEGLQSGARVLADMAGGRFEAALPHRLPPSLTAGAPLLPGHRDAFTSSLLFGGDLPGGAAIIISDKDAQRLALGLMPTERPDAAMIAAAIEEVANVLAHDVLAPLARELSVALMMAPPHTAQAAFSKAWPALVAEMSPQVKPPALYTGTLSGWGTECVIHFVLCLGGDFAERLAALRGAARVEVGLGELKLAQAPAVLRAASLGSCVAVVLFDPLGKKGVMSHVVMPQATSPEKAAAMPGKFADTAVAAALKKIGGGAGRLQAWMIGGANMFYNASAPSPLLQVGQRNVEGVRASFKENGFQYVVEEVGKNLGRTVELFTATGEVWVRSGSASQRMPTPQRKVPTGLTPRPKPKPETGKD
jgi:chemotaxis protein CheD